MRMKCKICDKCLCMQCHPKGECPSANGRRFFLLGALALPLAKKIVSPMKKIITEPELISGDLLGIDYQTIIIGNEMWFQPPIQEIDSKKIIRAKFTFPNAPEFIHIDR